MDYSGFPVLLDAGTLGFTRERDYAKAILDADFGGGYFAAATVDDPGGQLTFSFTWRGVHRDAALITDGDDTLSRVFYVWRFFEERMAQGNSPFVVEDLADGTQERTRHLVRFTSLKLSQQQSNKPWLYGFSLQARTVRLPDAFALAGVEGQIEQI